ncbi:FAD-dependent oxidoreductase [Actinomadura rayongensis]|uniref:Flavin-dependent monooxygenase n=1 Tax=Actinomadura rayongensis TaxID=1429076 RepID=A0A6I4WKU0_9ACTN|nr:NAD(P)/FAD-dependent oxidoreductase [Actinomadura rayongensis]MXQ67534.1 FAD-dependent monooxygenase [Actinomadura rayongensis]
MSQHHDIVIVGGGLSGLMLARILHVNGVEAVVLEAEKARDYRSQGRLLDIHAETGQAALRAAGLYEGFLAAYQKGAEATRIVDKHGEICMDEADEGRMARPEITRLDLRNLLLDSLPETTVRWNSYVPRVESLGDGTHRVHLEDGSTLTTRLLVGADGAWSNVRPLVSSAQPAYCGVSFVEANIHDADTRSPGAAKLSGPGMLFALDDEKGFLTHRTSDGELHVYYALKVAENWLDTVDYSNAEAVRAMLRDQFDGWDPRLRAMVEDADAPFVPRKLYALPVGLRWESKPGVTLVGDAAHLMSPFAGEGANIALHDGWELAEAILGSDDVDQAVAAYELTMFDRGKAMAELSADNLHMCFEPNAAQAVKKRIDAFREEAEAKS